MRTELLSEFYRKCSEINADVTLSLFITTQFYKDNISNIDNNPESLSSVFYKDNIYSKSFNIRLKNIPDLVSENLIFISKSSYILLWTEFELYLKDMIKLIASITGEKRDKNESDLNNVFIVAKTDINNHLKSYEIDTINYIRKRRNQLTHKGGGIKKELLDIIKNKGNDINNYWRDIGLPMNALNFNDQLINGIDDREVIDIIRLLRALSAKIDHSTLTAIKKEDIIKYALERFRHNFAEKMKHKSRARIETMFLNALAKGFNLTKDDVDLSAITF